MTTTLESNPIWIRTLAEPTDPRESAAKARLRNHFLTFRERVAHLISTLGAELPALTVHDITHLDALWRVADQIAGADYQINPAEAFVLGGAFLLHDAAHVVAAYPRRLADIKDTVHWKDFIAQRHGGEEPAPGSLSEKTALFFVLRHLHAEQAHRLPHVEWQLPGTGEKMFLLESLELRQYYGDLIGQIASSHHWSPHRVAEVFRERIVTPPAFLPTEWQVDAMKLAFLLRTADAAHIDDQRAPWFLFALRQPSGISESHWRFQAKLGQCVRTAQGELRISGSPFAIEERTAWWLAYDTARMIDDELRAARAMLQEEGRTPFAATTVQGVETPEAFSRHVPTTGWQPVGIAPRIDDVSRVIEMLGGSKLYGDEPAMALRELLQNSIDAVRALRAIGGLDDHEGQVVVSLENCGASDSFVLRVTDTGIGMSRNVLSRVLLDFGQSLWKSDRIREEWPGLASRKFDAAGQFGIGFFSVFMLGDHVTVTTRRHSRHIDDSAEQWTLSFDSGVRGRPLLRESTTDELLHRAGTRISVRIPKSVCSKILEQLHAKRKQFERDPYINVAFSHNITPDQRRNLLAASAAHKGKPWLMDEHNCDSEEAILHWASLIAWLCPSSDVSLDVCSGSKRQRAVVAGDWKTLPDEKLLARLFIEGNGPLIAINSDGECLGRLGICAPNQQAEATLTYGGLRCGKIEGLCGIALAKRTEDLRRQEAVPLASVEAFDEWARSILQLSVHKDLRQLRTLHALCRELDVPVVVIGGGPIASLAQCEILLRNLNKASTMFEELHAKAWDPPEWAGFGGVRVAPAYAADVWLFPQPSGYLPKALAGHIAPVDYQDRFEECLLRAWGEFSKEEADITIATVSGQPVVRQGVVYSRVMQT